MIGYALELGLLLIMRHRAQEKLKLTGRRGWSITSSMTLSLV
jgi:hypothetical protein